MTLGSDLSSVIVAVGAGVTAFASGDAIFGVTNARFTGAYAEYAIQLKAKISVLLSMAATTPASDWPPGARSRQVIDALGHRRDATDATAACA